MSRPGAQDVPSSEHFGADKVENVNRPDYASNIDHVSGNQFDPIPTHTVFDGDSLVSEDAFSTLHNSLVETIATSNSLAEPMQAGMSKYLPYQSTHTSAGSEYAYFPSVVPAIAPLSHVATVPSPLASSNGIRDQLVPHVQTQLDLICLTNNIYLSGFPWTHRTEKLSHRNNIDEMAAHLDATFGVSNYLVVYIDESSETIDTSPFHHQAVFCQFSNTSKSLPTSPILPMLTLDWLLDIVFALDGFIRLDDQHHAVVLFDKHGYSTLTRVVASAYLRYTHYCRTCADAWLYICSKSENVVLPISEKRNLQYFDDLLRHQGRLSSCPISLHRVIVNFPPVLENEQVQATPLESSKRVKFQPYLHCPWEMAEPQLELWQNNECIYSSLHDSIDHSFEISHKFRKDAAADCVYVDMHHLMFLADRKITKDIQMRLIYPKTLFLKKDLELPHSLSIGNQEPLESDSVVFKFSFHCGFITPGVVRINAAHIEPCHTRKYALLLDTDFSVDLIFFEQQQQQQQQLRDFHYETKLNRAMMLGLSWLVENHCMTWSKEYAYILQEQGYKRLLVRLALMMHSNDLHDTHEYLARHHKTIIETVSQSMFDGVEEQEDHYAIYNRPSQTSISPESPSNDQQSSTHGGHSPNSLFAASDEFLMIAEKEDKMEANINILSRHQSSTAHQRMADALPLSSSPFSMRSPPPRRAKSTEFYYDGERLGGRWSWLLKAKSAEYELYKECRIHHSLPNVLPSAITTFGVQQREKLMDAPVGNEQNIKTRDSSILFEESPVVPVLLKEDDVYSSVLSPKAAMVVESTAALPIGIPPPSGAPPPPPAPTLASILSVPSGKGGSRTLSKKSILRWQALTIPQDRLKGTVWFNDEFDHTTLSEDQRASLESWRNGQLVDEDMLNTVKALFLAPKATTAAQKGGNVYFTTGLDKSGIRHGGANTNMSPLEVRRANNLAIGLRRFVQRGLSFSDIRSAIVRFDETILSADDLLALHPLLPTYDEVIMLAQVDVLTTGLGEPEKFIAEMSKTAGIAKYLDIFLFYLQAPGDIANLEKACRGIFEACDALVNSKNLKMLLQLILRLGNLMQDVGNSSGPVVTTTGSGDKVENLRKTDEMEKKMATAVTGFRLESLLKLKEVKSQNGKVNFLEYLGSVIKEKFPDLVGLPGELGFLQNLQNFETVEFLADVKAIERLHSSLYLWLKKAQQGDNTHRSSAASTDIERMLGQFVNLEQSIRVLKESIVAMQNKASFTLCYFGETPDKNLKIEYLMKILYSFLSALLSYFEAAK